MSRVAETFFHVGFRGVGGESEELKFSEGRGGPNRQKPSIRGAWILSATHFYLC